MLRNECKHLNCIRHRCQVNLSCSVNVATLDGEWFYCYLFLYKAGTIKTILNFATIISNSMYSGGVILCLIVVQLCQCERVTKRKALSTLGCGSRPLNLLRNFKLIQKTIFYKLSYMGTSQTLNIININKKKTK